MATTKAPAGRDRRVVLSTLWIFAVLNYLYADVFGLFFNPSLQPDEWSDLLAGNVDGMEVTQGFVLTFAVLMETAIAMVVLARLLPYRANRWVNVAVGAFHTALVAWSLTGGAVNLFYGFFATIEIACTVFIVWYAWRWAGADGQLPLPAGRQDRGATEAQPLAASDVRR
jgi:hypothetical protein